jgi:3-dehydroquinate synthase
LYICSAYNNDDCSIGFRFAEYRHNKGENRTSMIVHQSFKVNFEYKVGYTRDLFDEENTTLVRLLGENRSKVMIFVDDKVAEAFPALVRQAQNWAAVYPDSIDLVTPVEIIPGGEAIKNGWQAVTDITRRMMGGGICRHSYVMIVGGGAVLDAVGFAAAIFHRGVRQIRVPTTLLAQDDSGVGVKNGINHNGAKNLFGCFYPPDAVIIDYQFLRTLSDRDIQSGVAEALKVALIKDKALYHFIKANADAIRKNHWPVLEHLVLESSRLHLEHIGSGDPFEKGSSRPLDFGHWSAHKLETMSQNEIRHGEAVAIGMALDICCAALMEMISMALAEDILETMRNCGLVLWHSTLLQCDDSGQLRVLSGLEEFREHLGGRLTLAMPTGIGSFVDIHELPEHIVEKALGMLQAAKM